MRKLFTDGKNLVLPYYIKSLVNYIIPKSLFRFVMARVISKVESRSDYDYIIDRVNYYNKLVEKQVLPETKTELKEFMFKRIKCGSRYFFDAYEYLKYFNDKLYFDYLFEDVTFIPESPKIVKSRPIDGDNKNSIIINLDKLRHFIFIKDKIPFRQKQDKAIFLSYIHGKPHRVDFMKKFFNSPICRCGDVQYHEEMPTEWHHKKISLWAHLKYKFILTIEGNDVATNLKWVMSSNCLAVMPKPKYETWFMEGKLIANYHYVEIKSDYSDFEQRIKYYTDHPDEAEQIIKNANSYIDQFRDKKREKIISYLVLKKYLSKVNL